MMGAVAEAGADCLVLTSDNPRSESPDAVIQANPARAAASRRCARRSGQRCGH
ncbi:MAG: hypothetical protein MZW92_43940 [Comamonadaceae bacterium]|nr:hypothetical protein [Comamonadaceae bacterium]